VTDPILTSFEIAAEKGGDLTDDIYQRYFASCPESEELMLYMDKGVKGKMIQEVLRLIMVDNYGEEEAYLNFEVQCHKASFKVQSYMYQNLLNAVFESVKDSIGDDWSDDFENAWSGRTGALLGEIESRHQAL
jgi:hemoglobin-like flavoprotein